MKRTISFVILFLVFQSFLSAQNESSEFDTRHYAGGSFGLQFGTISNIHVAPYYGFYFFKRLSGGVGFTYQYYNNSFYVPSINLNIIGGSFFGRFDIFDQLYLHGEYEMLTYKTDIFNLTGKVENIISENLLVGAGYRQLFSDFTNDNAYIMLLFNLNETQYTPYANPVIRIGLEFHF